MRRILPHGLFGLSAFFLALLLTSGCFAASVAPANGTDIRMGVFGFTQNAGGAAPVFAANDRLVSLGENGVAVPGLGTIGAQLGGTNLVGGADGYPFTVLATGAAASVNSAQFGFGSTTFALFPFFVGVNFALGDVTANDGSASISYNAANETFTANAPVAGWAGAVLAFHGTFGGQANAVVGAGLKGTIAKNGAAVPWANIVLAGSSIAGQPDSISGQFTSFNYFNCNTNFGGAVGVGCNDFVAAGISLTQFLTLNAGDTLTVDGTLSLLADPMASMDIISIDDPRFTNPIAPSALPTLGIAAQTPEPASWILAGIGLLLMALGRYARPRVR